MKKISLFILVGAISLLLAGCGETQSTVQKAITGANIIGAAQDLNKDSNNAQAISSDDSANNILTIMNYQGTAEAKEKMKQAIKAGVEDGKVQAELNKEIVTDKEIGSGYLLGYTFGCKAVTGDEAKCSDDMGAKYQTIMTEELQKQFQTMASGTLQ